MERTGHITSVPAQGSQTWFQDDPPGPLSPELVGTCAKGPWKLFKTHPQPQTLMPRAEGDPTSQVSFFGGCLGIFGTGRRKGTFPLRQLWEQHNEKG